MLHPPQHERHGHGPARERRRRPAVGLVPSTDRAVAGTLSRPSRRRTLALAAVLLAGGAVIGALAGLSLGRPSDLVVVGRSPLLDRPAPAFELERLAGGRLSLAELHGRPVVINFWASWCIPCRDEFPLLGAARREHAGSGLEVVGIVHDDEPANAARFATDLGATWPLVLDPFNEAWRAYGGTFLPLTYFVDREGVVRAVSYGTPTAESLAVQLAKIVGD